MLGVGGYLVYSEWNPTRTAMTTLTLTKRVVIHDREGKTSTLYRIQKVRANDRWVEEIWFRDMVTDGSFGPVKIDGEIQREVTRLGCLRSYSKKINLARGKTREVKLECSVSDAFPSSEEGLLHEVGQGTECLVLEVELPADRVCLLAQLTLDAAGETARILQEPEISTDRRTICSAIKNPKTGFTYNLSWTW
jgi:hypothetical protein